MIQVNDLLQQRHQRREAAHKLMNAAVANGKDLQGPALKEYDSHIAAIASLQSQLDAHAAGAYMPGQGAEPSSAIHVSDESIRAARGAALPKQTDMFPEVSNFIRTGKLGSGITASLQEGSDLSVAIPPYQLEGFRTIVPGLFPFESAGATIFDSADFGMHKISVPFVIQSGTAVSTFAEGAGPSADQPATVKAVSLTATKYAFLTKLSEEVDADISGLGAALTREGISRVATATTAAASTALLASLSGASATVTPGADFLESLLKLEAAIPPAFASPGNAFMCSRTGLSRLRNVRDLQNRPIFDPVAKTILSYPVHINDFLDPTGHHWVLFGNWNQGAFLSYSQFSIWRLLEAYRESGQIGIRFARRFASAFYSDASTDATVQPIYRLDLGA